MRPSIIFNAKSYDESGDEKVYDEKEKVSDVLDSFFN